MLPIGGLFIFFVFALMTGAGIFLIIFFSRKKGNSQNPNPNQYQNSAEGYQTYTPPQPASPVYTEASVTPAYMVNNSTAENNVYSEQVPPAAQPQDQLAAELQRFKKLYEDGLISEEEFLAKKKQLLNI